MIRIIMIIMHPVYMCMWIYKLVYVIKMYKKQEFWKFESEAR